VSVLKLIIASKVHEVLFNLPEYHSAKKIGIFLSMPVGEINTRPIVLNAINHGKIVFIPYLYKAMGDDRSQSVMDMVALHSREDYESLSPDKWGIPSLQAESLPGRMRCLGNENEKGNNPGIQELDMIIMPGVGFDKKLQRLGHGKGFYDFFLAQYNTRIRNLTTDSKRMPSLGKRELFFFPFFKELRFTSLIVAIALKEQLLSESQVPVTSTDWPIDTIILGDGSVLRREE
jgi:5-formyltetrahydrofolate cyclo-ligase